MFSGARRKIGTSPPACSSCRDAVQGLCGTGGTGGCDGTAGEREGTAASGCGICGGAVFYALSGMTAWTGPVAFLYLEGKHTEGRLEASACPAGRPVSSASGLLRHISYGVLSGMTGGRHEGVRHERKSQGPAPAHRPVRAAQCGQVFPAQRARGAGRGHRFPHAGQHGGPGGKNAGDGAPGTGGLSGYGRAGRSGCPAGGPEGGAQPAGHAPCGRGPAGAGCSLLGGCGRRYHRPSGRCGHPLCRGGQQPRRGGRL